MRHIVSFPILFKKSEEKLMKSLSLYAIDINDAHSPTIYYGL
jgi:hypothetical protein